MNFLTGLLASIIRPIIREEIADLKAHLSEQINRQKAFSEFDREADELIKAADQATTTEEVKAHLRRLKEARAKLGV